MHRIANTRLASQAAFALVCLILTQPVCAAAQPAPITPRGGQPAARLRPPSTTSNPPPAPGLPAPAVMVASLAFVLGLFFLIVWVWRRATPVGSGLLPADVVQVLGRAPLAARQQMHLVRCGGKLLLVSVSAAGAETLTEISDPVEVDRLAGICQQAHSESATATFRNILQQLSVEKPAATHDAAIDRRIPAV